MRRGVKYGEQQYSRWIYGLTGDDNMLVSMMFENPRRRKAVVEKHTKNTKWILVLVILGSGLILSVEPSLLLKRSSNYTLL